MFIIEALDSTKVAEISSIALASVLTESSKSKDNFKFSLETSFNCKKKD